MNSKLMSILGIVVSFCAVLASPEFVALVPPATAHIAMLVGAVAAAVGKSLVGSTGSKQMTYFGVTVAVLAVLASPEFTAIVSEKIAGFAALLGALVAAAGASLFPAPPAE
jgi:hypothetical protein